jgi:hypothetical protein
VSDEGARPSEPDGERDGILGWLERQGYPLEYEAGRWLVAAGFSVHHGRYYVDTYFGEEEHREIDLLAHEPDHAATFHVWLTAECKMAPAPWVVLTSTQSPEPEEIASYFPATQWAGETLRRRAADQDAMGDVFRRGDRLGFNVAQAARQDSAESRKARDKADPKLPYEALQTSVKAARYFARHSGDYPTVVLPIVVVGGPLYWLGYTMSGEPQLQATDWERIVWYGASATSPSVVYIVRSSALEGFALLMRGVTQRIAMALSERERDPLSGP